MIIDTLNNHAVYRVLGPKIAVSFTWLNSFSINTPDGRYEIAGKDIFALVQSYSTVSAIEKKFESHRDYIDIQYVAAGSEIIYYAPIGILQAASDYRSDEDYQLFKDPTNSTPLQLTEGSFSLFYPQDGHKPGCTNGATGWVKKVVMKVRV